MFSKSNWCGKQPVYCDSEINDGDRVFLDICNEELVSLFDSCYHAAAISDKGEVIFLNRYTVKYIPKSQIACVSLPNNEKASCVSCLNNSFVILSSNGRMFSSSIERAGEFSLVSELDGYEIVCVSGTNEHYLAVSKEGCAFGCGSNLYGRISFIIHRYLASVQLRLVAV